MALDAPTWQFSAPTRVQFGRGTRSKLGTISATYGRHALLVTGGKHLSDSGKLENLRNQLQANGVASTVATVSAEPDDACIDQLALVGRSNDCDCIIAIGGGSALDAGKAAAALITNAGACVDYLEGLPDRDTQPLEQAPLPIIALPTTAGTGSEVTTNAVILAKDYGLKRSLRDPRLTPRDALVDSELMQGAPISVAAAAGLDALAHNLESFLSTGASPITDDMAVDGIEQSLHFLRELADSGEPTASAWDGVALAALTGGWCIANARLGAAHGLVSPLCGRFPVPHGVGVACLTAPALLLTDRILHERAISHPARMRLHEAAGIISGRGSSTPEAADTIDRLRQNLELPSLRHYGVDLNAIGDIAKHPSGSIKTHPVELSHAECEEILQRAL